MAFESNARVFSPLPLVFVISGLVTVGLDVPQYAIAQPSQSDSCSASLPERTRQNCSETGAPATPGMFLRQIGWLCGPEEKSCDGDFGVPSGSGGADVDAFYSMRREPAASDVKVQWVCPDPKHDVLVTLLIRGHSWQWRGPCAKEVASFRLQGFAGRERGYILPRAKLVPLLKCALPVYLVARLTVPPGYFATPNHKCRGVASPNACLIVSSVLSSRDGWEIAVGPEIQRGTGRIVSEELAVSKPIRCGSVDLYVDFREREADRQNPGTTGTVVTPVVRTTVGELLF